MALDVLMAVLASLATCRASSSRKLRLKAESLQPGSVISVQKTRGLNGNTETLVIEVIQLA